MKKGIQKMMTLLVLITVLSAASTVLAASGNKPRLLPNIVWEKQERIELLIENVPEDAKLLSVKSSNPKVIRVNGYGEEMHSWGLDALKVGKSTITIEYKASGKINTISAVYTVKKYPNAFEYIKVNGKKIDLKKYPYVCNFYHFDEKSAVFSYKLAKGWKAVTEKVWIWDVGYTNFREKPLKSQTSYKLKKNQTFLALIEMENAKKEILTYNIFFRGDWDEPIE